MLKFSSIKKLGKRPKAVRSKDEFEARLEMYRSWNKGIFNKSVSWFLQAICVGIGFNVFLRIFNKIKIVNINNVQQMEPPYLFVTNHHTMFDDFFLGALLFFPRALFKMKYLPYHTPEEQNFFLGPIVTFMMQRLRCIPLTRGHGVFQPGMAMLKELLTTHSSVQMYPEGTRSRSGDIGKGKVGIGRLAYQTKTRVLPCYHEGTQDILPIGAHRLKLGKRMHVIVGEPH